MEWDGKGSGFYKPNRGLGSALKSPQLLSIPHFNSAIFPFGPTLLFAPLMLLDPLKLPLTPPSSLYVNISECKIVWLCLYNTIGVFNVKINLVFSAAPLPVEELNSVGWIQTVIVQTSLKQPVRGCFLEGVMCYQGVQPQWLAAWRPIGHRKSW